jgi:hypothetical protein
MLSKIFNYDFLLETLKNDNTWHEKTNFVLVLSS